MIIVVITPLYNKPIQMNLLPDYHSHQPSYYVLPVLRGDKIKFKQTGIINTLTFQFFFLTNQYSLINKICAIVMII
jgi:hypothetical protein